MRMLQDNFFWIGCIGGLSAEIGAWFFVFRSLVRPEPGAGKKTLPPQPWYIWAGYLVCTALMAAIGGFLASAIYRVQQGVLAFHIGVSAPVLLRAFFRSAPKLG